MNTFSERMDGSNYVRIIQINDMDISLKNGIWNVFNDYFFVPYLTDEFEENYEYFVQCIWRDFFKLTVDVIPVLPLYVKAELKTLFFHKWDYLRIYDFVEFFCQNGIDVNKFTKDMNHILEREMSGYRIRNKILVPITSDIELNQIDSAIEQLSQYDLKYVNLHLTRALEMLSDRKKPDYRNSIKESISAVETICKIIVKDEKAHLRSALKKINKKMPLHKNLELAFENLYHYTSDKDGIRHSILNSPDIDVEDSILMLTLCSSFVSYLISKSNKYGVDLKFK